MEIRHPPGICENCGYIGPMPDYAMSGEGTQMHFIGGCTGTCPCCNQQAKVIDGGYEIIDGALKIIRGAQLNKSDAKRLQKTLSDALLNNVKNIEKKLRKLGRQFLPIAKYAGELVIKFGPTVALIILKYACSQSASVENNISITNNYYQAPKVQEEKKLEDQGNKKRQKASGMKDV